MLSEDRADMQMKEIDVAVFPTKASRCKQLDDGDGVQNDGGDVHADGPTWMGTRVSMCLRDPPSRTASVSPVARKINVLGWVCAVLLVINMSICVSVKHAYVYVCVAWNFLS